MYNVTLKNIQQLIELRKEKGSELNIGTTFLITEHNVDEILPFYKKMKDMGVDSITYKQDINMEEPHFIKKCNELLDEFDNEEGFVDIRRFKKIDPFNKNCFIPHFKIALDPYGHVYSCCLASQPNEKNGYLLGDVRENNFEKIWTNSRNLREKMRSSGVNCKHCNHTDYEINMRFAKLS